jgi:hypothetical protein
MQDEFDDEAMAAREWTDAITSVIEFGARGHARKVVDTKEGQAQVPLPPMPT